MIQSALLLNHDTLDNFDTFFILLSNSNIYPKEAISFRTGIKYFRKLSGFSLIGKCPRFFITVAFEPLIRFAVASKRSGVHEQSYSPDIR